MNKSISIRRARSLMLAAFMIASQLATASSSDNGTLTIGVGGNGSMCGIGLVLILSGYVPSISKGSYSPTTLTGGNTVAGVIDFNVCATGSELQVSGYSSNPGASWLSSITCNGVENKESAASFSYTSGTATWQWSDNFGFATTGSGTEVSCTIVHS